MVIGFDAKTLTPIRRHVGGKIEHSTVAREVVNSDAKVTSTLHRAGHSLDSKDTCGH